VSNKQAVIDFGSKSKRSLVAKLCRLYFAQYRKCLEAVSLFDTEDVEQEVWCKLLESNTYSDEEEFVSYADGILKHLLEKGRDRVDSFEMVSVSQLPHKDKRKVDNIMYGGSGDGYDEESQP
jgi:hypothetical protein